MDVLQRLNEGSFVKQLHQERFFMCGEMYKERHHNCVPIPVIHWWIKFSGSIWRVLAIYFIGH